MAATNEFVEELILQNANKKGKTIQVIFQKAKEILTRIQQEINIYASVSSGIIQQQRLKTSALVDTAEAIKENLREACVLLDQEHSEIEILNKFLRNYNEIFFHAREEFEKCWQNNASFYENALQRLEETEGQWNSTTKKIYKSFRYILQQSKSLQDLLFDTENILQYCKNLANIPQSLENLGEGIDGFAEVPWAEKLIDFCQKLEKVLKVSDSINVKLQSISQTSTKVENLHDLVKSIAAGYNSLVKFLLSYKGSRATNNKPQDRTDLDHSTVQYEDNRNLRMFNNRENIVQENNNDMHYEMNYISNHEINILRNEGYCEDNSTEFKDIDAKKLTILLKDVAQMTKNLVDCDRFKVFKEDVRHVGYSAETDQVNIF